MSDYRTSATSILRLLVSVANAEDAAAALAGGADVIDAKNPGAGPLGAVSADTLRDIDATIAGARLVTAAIGDATDEQAIEGTACTFVAAGAMLVKVGFAGVTSASRVEALIKAAVRGVKAGRSIRLKPDPTTGRTWDPLSGGPIALTPDLTGVVAVAYADADRVGSLAPQGLVAIASRAGATGVLLDTADKSGPGLRALVTPTAIAHWVRAAQEAGLLVALAGQLTADDLAFVYDAGADIAGVRGAACDGGRTGRVSSDRVATLRALCGSAKPFRRTALAEPSAGRPTDPPQPTQI